MRSFGALPLWMTNENWPLARDDKYNDRKMKKYHYVLLPLVILSVQACAVFNHGLETSDEPAGSKLITKDIDHFYTAFDLVVAEPARAEEIFKRHYFNKGSRGLEDFYETKIQSTKRFAEFVVHFKDYYQSIREDISNLSDLENRIHKHFEEFEELYPRGTYPDVYFLVGKYQSNGTISNNGLLIGTEILARTSKSDTANWNRDILRISMPRKHIPVTVSHELVHFNQGNMEDGNTLLWKSIREGSAEFIAELISGETDADFGKFKGREIEIWKDFQEDKNKSIWRSWQQKSDLRPKNAGYWAGYMICKAYYEQVRSKEKAVRDILNIQDYPEFYVRSKVDEYIQERFGDSRLQR